MEGTDMEESGDMKETGNMDSGDMKTTRSEEHTSELQSPC